MRQEIIIKSMARRISLPANLLMVGLVGGMFCLFRLVSRAPEAGPGDWFLPFILMLGHAALAPVPWQWTGNDADRAGIGRGLGQALCFDLAWVGLLLWGLHLLGGPAPHPHPFPPSPMPFPPFHPPPFPGQPFPGPPFPGQPFPGQPVQGQPFPGQPFPGHLFLPGLSLGLVNVAFGLIYGWVSAEKEATEACERRTAELLRQSRARALQNQLEPHVLFNALNGLAELVHEDPLAAEEVIVKLADLYRMLTVHGETGQIRLEEERRLVEAYLDMEQMRLGERLQVQWQWPAWADGQVLPPYFLLPLVENAVKHGISPAEAGGQMLISCARNGPGVQLRVENTGRPLLGERRGVGLGNLEARLGLWTELAGSFKLETRDGWTVATVQWIPEAG